jgi:Leucine-rich repeat (LRR) protein
MLERLKKLDVSNNRLVGDFIILQIVFVSYYKCVQARLPLGLEQLQALEKLNLAENPLQHLPLGLGGLPRLAVLLVTPGSGTNRIGLKIQI